MQIYTLKLDLLKAHFECLNACRPWASTPAPHRPHPVHWAPRYRGCAYLAPGATRRRRSYLLSHRAPLAASSGGGRRTAVFGDPACLRPGHLQGQKPTAVAPPGRLLACVFSAGNHVLYPRLMCEILDLCPQSPVKIFPPGHPTTVRSVSLASSINFIGHHRPRNQDK